MKKVYKYISYFIIVTAFVFLSATDVKAYKLVDDDCVKKETCMPVCNYLHKSKGGTNNKDIIERNITIYYYYDGNWQIKWENLNTEKKVLSTPKDSFAKVFGRSSVKLGSTITEEKFKCPTYGFLDISKLNGGNEICLADSSDYCVEASNIGTTFGKKSKDYISTQKDYMFNLQLSSYFNGSAFKDITDDDLKKGLYASEEDMINKFNRDLKENFMKGHDIPPFITNSYEYTTKKDTLKRSYQRWKEDKEKEVEQKVQSGEMTQEEAQQIKGNLNKLDKALSEALEGDFEAKLNKYKEQENGNLSGEAGTPESESLNCKTLLGDPKDPNKQDLAYWIQWCLNLIKYIAIIALLGLSTVDFIKAIVSNDKDAIKKAAGTTIKRFVIVVVLFFLPIIVEIIMKLFGAYGTCNIG